MPQISRLTDNVIDLMPPTAPATTVGTMWYDAFQQTVGTNIGQVGNPIKSFPVVVLFTSTATATSNTKGTTSSLIPSGVGNLVLPPNFLVPGKTLRIHAWGIATTAATHGCPLNFNIKLGTTTIMASATNTPSASASNVLWKMDSSIVCQTSGGTVRGQGTLSINVSPTTVNNWDLISTSPIVVNTTIPQTIGFEVTQGNNPHVQTIICTNFVLESLH